MTAPQPDIEIYLKRVELEDILAWLSGRFAVKSREPVGETLQLTLEHDGHEFTCSILEKAARGGYTSIWFRSDRTPWATDEDCAEEAFAHFQTEVRCSIGGWQPEHGEDAGWYRFTESGRAVVNWKT